MQFNSVCNIHFLLSIDHSYPEKKNTNHFFLRQNISVENSKFTFITFTIGRKVCLKNFMKLFLNLKSNANAHFFRSDFDRMFSMQWLIMFLPQDAGPRKPSLSHTYWQLNIWFLEQIAITFSYKTKNRASCNINYCDCNSKIRFWLALINISKW